MNEYKIDAAGKAMGRVASEAAKILMGKDQVDFAANKVAPSIVIIDNLEKLYFPATKLINKKYYRHSGYIGHLKEKTLGKRVEDDLEGLFRDCVKRMLPDNRLRDQRLRRLKIGK